MGEEGRQLRIDADVQAVLEKRGIREEDIQKVLDFAEETGNVYMHPDTGHLLSYFTPATTTYWVEFGRDGGAYRIYRAYSHRMEILHGFNMPAKKQQTLDWICRKCDRKLELATVKLRYMEETFGVDIPACPSCQRIFVSEEDATQRMALAEKMLEDK